jgi:hypothetical protein
LQCNRVKLLLKKFLPIVGTEQDANSAFNFLDRHNQMV